MRKSFSPLICLLALVMFGGVMGPTVTSQRPSRGELIREYATKRKALASDDATGHYKLGLWCEANEMKRRAKRHFNTVVKIDPNHGKARKKLGHVFKNGKWLSQKEMEEAGKEEKAKKMAARGMVMHEGKWVTKEDARRLKAGMVKQEGRWYTPKEAKMLKRGYIRHPETGDWIKKKDLEKARQGLFPQGRGWVTEEKANEFHSKWENRWQLRTQHYVLHTNLPWREARQKKLTVEIHYKRIKELAGGTSASSPTGKMNIFIFATRSDYNNYGSNNGTSYSSVYGGWFSLADRDKLSPAVCYWDKNFGRLYLPHAMAYQYFYMLFLRAGYTTLDKNDLVQKELPGWVIPGASAYCDRFWDEGLRKWSADMIIKGGGLASFDKSWFEGFAIMADYARESEHNIKNAGFLVCYLKHGGDKKAYDLWQDIFVSMGKGAKKEELGPKFKALQDHLVENKDKIKAFFQKVQTG